jgi:hypothetical protein
MAISLFQAKRIHSMEADEFQIQIDLDPASLVEKLSVDGLAHWNIHVIGTYFLQNFEGISTLK